MFCLNANWDKYTTKLTKFQNNSNIVKGNNRMPKQDYPSTSSQGIDHVKLVKFSQTLVNNELTFFKSVV